MDDVAITHDEVQRARRAYLGNVSYVDDWTGTLLHTLDAIGATDNTVIVLLADHGDMLGERGLWYKMSFFEGSCRIPLIVHWPDGSGSRRVSAPVSLVDVLPTIAAIAGVEGESFVDALAGQSLVDVDANTTRSVAGEYMAEGSCAPIVMIRREGLKFVHCPADPDQLYDVEHDPHETTNLCADPAWSDTVAAFRCEVADRWDLDELTAEVLADQAHRRLVYSALRSGRYTPWDYTPPRDGGSEYMRNHLDLNEVERAARWPR
jgi:choline-sulfatase